MNLYEEIYKLKTIERKGWLSRNCHSKEGRVESDAEHTFSMAILALEIMSKEKMELDQEKVLKMILYHEICEIDYGDHTPMEKISPAEKFEHEYQAVKRIADSYEMPEILGLWLEFEENKTPEAQFVKKVDKLDAMMQSKIYANVVEDETVFREFCDSRPEISGEFQEYLK
jgi:putative hydrolase of HD superfamily